MKYLITGANGFLGSAIVDRLQKDPGMELHLAVRKYNSAPIGNVYVHTDLYLENIKHWDLNLFNVDVIIHAAARAHIFNNETPNSLQDLRLINTLATIELAKRAANFGVKRFVFISSIKVNGEKTSKGYTFKPEDNPNPLDAYAISKYEAEKGLLQISKESKMELVIIRPVMVYGPGVKGNFLSLMKLVSKEIPIPLGLVSNMRSIISIDNLVDFILRSSNHPAAANQIFLISDGDDLSTPQLINRIALTMGVKNRIIKIPLWLLNILLMTISRGRYSMRLFNSLQVDISKSIKLLNWKPVANIDETLTKTVIFFNISKSH